MESDLNTIEAIEALHRTNCEATTPDAETAEIFWDNIVEIAKEYSVNIDHETQILDAGSGLGHLVEHITKKSLSCIGLDRYPRHQDRAQLPIIKARIEEMPFADGSFDIINSTMVFDRGSSFYPNQNAGKMCTEIWRVLKPGGIFVCSADGQTPTAVNLIFSLFNKSKMQKVTVNDCEYLVAQK